MSECKHGLKQGCFYCHNRTTQSITSQPTPKRRTKATRLSEQMNDRMTNRRVTLGGGRAPPEARHCPRNTWTRRLSS
jgi:pyruvate-formate lyase-activating enzyme